MDQYQANINTLLEIAGQDAPAVLLLSEGDNGIGIFEASIGEYELVVVSCSDREAIKAETYCSMAAALEGMNNFLRHEYSDELDGFDLTTVAKFANLDQQILVNLATRGDEACYVVEVYPADPDFTFEDEHEFTFTKVTRRKRFESKDAAMAHAYAHIC